MSSRYVSGFPEPVDGSYPPDDENDPHWTPPPPPRPGDDRCGHPGGFVDHVCPTCGYELPPWHTARLYTATDGVGEVDDDDVD